MNPETTQVDATKTAEQQLADIKSQAAKVVQAAQKVNPAVKVSEADAEMIGLPKLNIPTQTERPQVDPALSRVGTTTIPATGTDKAREALLSQVPESDRDTISAILDASMGLQTERGAQLEGDLESMTAQRLDLAQRGRERTREGLSMAEEQRLPELEAELESIRSEADVLSARRNAAIQAEARREGVSSSAQSNNIAAIEKDFNLQQANLAIRELASVGKINAATKLIQTKLDIKYGDIEAETELVKAQIESILPLLSREDAKVAEQRLLLNDVARATIEQARADDQALEEFKLQAYMNAQQNGATPALLSMIMSSDNREDVASVGGTFIQDPMQRLQMRQAEADIRATDALAAQRSGEVTGVGTTVNAATDMGLDGTSEDPMYTIMAQSAGGRVLTQSEAEPLTNAKRVADGLADLQAVISTSNTDPILGLFQQVNPYNLNSVAIDTAINTLVPQLARGTYGEVGVLTDADMARYANTLPNLTSTEAQNKAVMALTLRKVRSGFASQAESMAAAGRDVSGYQDIYRKFSAQIDDLESQIGVGRPQEENLDAEYDATFGEGQTRGTTSVSEDGTVQPFGVTRREGGSPILNAIGRFFFGE